MIEAHKNSFEGPATQTWIALMKMGKRRIKLGRYIVADPGICHARPTFKGKRILPWFWGVQESHSSATANRTGLPSARRRRMMPFMEQGIGIG